MGRLRDDYELPLFLDVAEEVTELFGIDDAVLYRFVAVDQLSNTDPLWDEPTSTVKYRPFNIKAMRLEPATDFESTEQGGHQNWTDRIYVPVQTLIRAKVPTDTGADYVAEGDVIEIYSKQQKPDFVYDVVQVDRVGWVNDTDKWTGYELGVTRRDKYQPERKL